MKEWDGFKFKNVRLRAGDEIWFNREEQTLTVRRLGRGSDNLCWLGGDNKRLASFVRLRHTFSDLARLLADVANLECGEFKDVNESWMVKLIPATKQ